MNHDGDGSSKFLLPNVAKLDGSFERSDYGSGLRALSWRPFHSKRHRWIDHWSKRCGGVPGLFRAAYALRRLADYWHEFWTDMPGRDDAHVAGMRQRRDGVRAAWAAVSPQEWAHARCLAPRGGNLRMFGVAESAESRATDCAAMELKDAFEGEWGRPERRPAIERAKERISAAMVTEAAALGVPAAWIRDRVAHSGLVIAGVIPDA